MKGSNSLKYVSFSKKIYSFLAVLGLPADRALSSCGEQGPPSSCCAWGYSSLWRKGFLLQWLLLLHMVSGVHGLP